LSMLGTCQINKWKGDLFFSFFFVLIIIIVILLYGLKGGMKL